MTAEAGRFGISSDYPVGVMKVIVQIEFEEGEGELVPIGRIERNGPLQAGTLGLTLAESKALLEALQRKLVKSLFRLHLADQHTCSQCGARRAIKDYHMVCFKSLFGDVNLRIPRVYHCRCAGQVNRAKTIGIEGLSHWVSPELEYMQSQLAATPGYEKIRVLCRARHEDESFHIPLWLWLPYLRSHQKGRIWRLYFLAHYGLSTQTVFDRRLSACF